MADPETSVTESQWEVLEQALQSPAFLETRESHMRVLATLASLREQAELLHEFVFNAPTCIPTEENHYGWPKEGVRWRCFNCNEWCYPTSPCYGCAAREMQATLSTEVPSKDDLVGPAKDYTHLGGAPVGEPSEIDERNVHHPETVATFERHVPPYRGGRAMSDLDDALENLKHAEQAFLDMEAKAERMEAALREIAAGDEYGGLHLNVEVGSQELRRIARAALSTEEPSHEHEYVPLVPRSAKSVKACRRCGKLEPVRVSTEEPSDD